MVDETLPRRFYPPTGKNIGLALGGKMDALVK
jgi:hypothetical protein